MDRYALGRLLGTGVLAVTLAVGCSHTRRSPMNGPVVCCPPEAGTVVATAPSQPMTVVNGQPVQQVQHVEQLAPMTCANCTPSPVGCTKCGPAACSNCTPCNAGCAPCQQKCVGGCAPCQHQCVVCPPGQVIVQPAIQTVAHVEAEPAAVSSAPTKQIVWHVPEQPDTNETKFPRGAPHERRTYTDVTAASCFGRAADYSWLVGQVEQARTGAGYRLRFASVDDNDRYGGSVTLAGDGNLPTLKDGQYIRVRGHLVDAEAHSPAPAYHVESCEPVH